MRFKAGSIVASSPCKGSPIRALVAPSWNMPKRGYGSLHRVKTTCYPVQPGSSGQSVDVYDSIYSLMRLKAATVINAFGSRPVSLPI